MRAVNPLSVVAILPVLLFLIPQEVGEEIDASRERWNEVFTEAEQRGVRWNPSPFLVDVVGELEAGTALDIGMGQGRNALFLAERGWQVTGFDISDIAVGQAQQSAAASGLELDAQISNLNDFDYGEERWDLITVFFMHELILPRAAQIMASLKPGGRLVIEGFHRDVKLRNHADEPFGYLTNQLLQVFDDLRILRYEDRVDVAEWFKRQEKPLVRLVATKEAAPSAK